MAAEFDTSHVKNIVLLGHAGSGKTTLAECFLFEAGLISRRGTIAEKNTVGDYHELEQERGNTIFSKLMHTKWRGYKINIIDTPGYDDFAGEVLSALRVADTGIMLLNAAMGVEVSTEVIWQYTERFKTPMIFAVNHLDDEKASFDDTVNEAKRHFGSNVTVIQYPLEQGEGFHRIIDVLRMTMYTFKDTGGKPEKLPIPPEEKEKADRLHKELIEAVAGNDETLMEKYFEKGELDEDEIRTGMKKAMINHDLFPLFCLSAERNMGSGRLMGFIDNVCPSADEIPPQVSVNGEIIPCDAGKPVCAFVYKAISEPHVGELSFMKVFSGTLKAGMDLLNETTGVSEKLNQLFVMEGNKRNNVGELSAGDIGATLKLKNTHVNNTLHERNVNYALQPIEFPAPNMSIAVRTVKKGEEEKLSAALHQLREEDPTLIVKVSSELKQTIIYCQGDMHLAVIKWKLQHQHRVDVVFEAPGIPYRETIRTAAEAVYRHKKQSGGAGQFGEVHMRIEPWYEGMPEPAGLNVRGRDTQELPWGGKLVFYNCIVGGAIDQRFLPSILKGVMQKMQEGPLTGSYVRDIRVSVFDGRMHPVDSNDISFKIAGLMAFKNAFQMAAPQLLEPVYQVEVLCPEDVTGAVMGDLQTRRALVEGMDAERNFTRIMAKVPLAEMNDYSSSLRSITQGRAKFKMQFYEYVIVPFEIQRKLTEQYNKTAKEEMVG
ncbi:elongation factor G [Agriterribacter sp.]|uniref:elongation factor G n=1 Tax=Agriterribacter sp. TaxID=2821509 RepID=UPI002C2314B0|nr:elongation factor G [Agriterribacter sp.]HRO45957.1 elongation factor G [Agriterribacter sp.]HRQ19312.1 elongation factor G [Agriterribacter sp.]